MKIKDIYDYLNLIAPVNTALNWDNCGLLVGDINQNFVQCLICLDVTDNIVDEAIEKKCNLIISHHPVIFNKLNKITSNMLIYKLIKNNINVISLHTNLDMAEHGINFALAKKLGLNIIEPLTLEYQNFYKITVKLPIQFKDVIINSMLNSGAIKYNTFENNNVQANNEITIDVLVCDKNLDFCLSNMLKSHPNKNPIYYINKIGCNESCLSMGLIGNLNKEYSPIEFTKIVKTKLKCKKISYISGNKGIKLVAICGGSGGSFVKTAIAKGADAYITSEIKYNVWVETKNLTLIDAGHFNTENVITSFLADKLNHHFKCNDFSVACKNIDIINVL